MSENIKLNLGCSCFKIPGFKNIDCDPKMKPDLCIDILNIDKHFSPNSVDFIVAGHFFEHLSSPNGLKVLSKCYDILKPYRTIWVTVPDYTKCKDLDISLAEKIILGQGEHKVLMDASRLESMLLVSGFSYYTEVKDLKRIPFLIVSDTTNPKPDPWQTSFIALKI